MIIIYWRKCLDSSLRKKHPKKKKKKKKKKRKRKRNKVEALIDNNPNEK
jgi:hypothetical protein